MTDCTFHLNTDHRWQCTECGWVYPRQAEKPPRRNCPKAPRRKRRKPQSPLDKIISRYDAMTPDDRTPDREEIKRRVDICTANECGHFAGVCTDIPGSACRRWERWLERVIFGKCRWWEIQ